MENHPGAAGRSHHPEDRGGDTLSEGCPLAVAGTWDGGLRLAGG